MVYAPPYDKEDTKFRPVIAEVNPGERPLTKVRKEIRLTSMFHLCDAFGVILPISPAILDVPTPVRLNPATIVNGQALPSERYAPRPRAS